MQGSSAHPKAQLFRLLAGIFFRELTDREIALYREAAAEPLLAAAGSGRAAQQAVADFRFAIANWEQHAGLKRALAADYARLFLLPGRSAAPPYASAYLEEGGQLAGAAHDRMTVRLTGAGMALSDGSREPADHLSVMLEYLAELYGQEAPVEPPEAFIAVELLPWTGRFAAAASRVSPHDCFYAAAARLCAATLEGARPPVRPA